MKKRSYILFLALIIGLSGCSKLEDFGDTNVNPNTTSTPVTAALLTNTLSNLVKTASGVYFCQYFSQTNYVFASLYAYAIGSPMGNYSEALYDLQNIIKINNDEATMADAEPYGTNENQIAIARILKAYIYWTITDTWGDVPYTDALKGNSDVAFDPQEIIYKDLIKELTEAVSQFVQPVIQVKGDIAYDGDIVKWKKLANSLRMLMALNLSKQYPEASGYAATQFNSALSNEAGSISDNTDNFKLVYPGDGIFNNPYYSMYAFGQRMDGESETMTSLLTDTIGNDARQAVFGADASGAPSTVGVPYGRESSYIQAWCQTHPDYCYVFAPAYRTEASPAYIIMAANVLLARAEAADRGWTNENASELYQAGVTASFTQWDLEPPDAGYFLKSAVALGPAGSNLRQIATQQYIAYFPNGLQGWNTWRRTGRPVLYPAPDAVNKPPVIPRRFMYGAIDYILNPEGIAAAIERLGPNGDKNDSRVWWDKEE